MSNTNKTIDNIKNTEIFNSFSGLLRGAVMAQGGVSSDELKSTLTTIIDRDYFDLTETVIVDLYRSK